MISLDKLFEYLFVFVACSATAFIIFSVNRIFGGGKANTLIFILYIIILFLFFLILLVLSLFY